LNFQPHELIALIIWFLALFLLAGGTLICSVLCLCFKQRRRAIAIDVLLWLATLTVVVFYSANFLPSKISKGPNSESLRMSYIKKADLTGLDILSVSYMTRLESPWKEIAHLEGAWSLQKVLEQTEKTLHKISKDHPDDATLASRLAIVIHTSGGPLQKEVFGKFPDTKDPLLRFLRELYTAENKKLSDNSISLPEIKDKLPEGWYRDTVLKKYYKKTSASAQLAELEQKQEKRGSQWLSRYKSIQLVTLFIALIGIPAIYLFCTSKRELLPEPANYGFRKVYGCFLACLYAQCMAGGLVGFCVGILAGSKAVLHHSNTLEIPNTSSIFIQAVVIAGVVAALLGFYVFVCRPAGVSIRKALMDGDQVREIWKGIVHACMGFCSAVFVAVVAHLIFSWMGRENTVSEATLQLVDSVVSTNLLVLLWSCCWFCILAPVTEEVQFRVLMYPWLRHRLGVLAGVIISAAVFSFIHFNFVLFFHFFLIGAVLAIVFERTRNFPIIVGIHGLWNAWVIIQVSSLIPR
jgi:membrane protease YdiL (CAAX protease family)